MLCRLLASAALALLCACPHADSGASCAITDDGGVLDVRGLADGIYGVIDDRVISTPLARFDRMHRTGGGTDTRSGKRWVGVRLDEVEGQQLREFTSVSSGRSIAVLVGGEVASRHKVRATITGGEAQVSCCNRRACDRWEALLGAR